MVREPRTLKGTITSWNDERGFGFISPTVQGERIFVHISAFPRYAPRPSLGDVVRYRAGYSADGKRRATSAWRSRHTPGFPGRRTTSGSGSYVVILAFVALYIVVTVYWSTPLWVAVVYGIVSLACFAIYAVDKSAALSGRWRVSEATLFLLGIAGGWPGAILAQQTLRHKTIKPGFRVVHWISVVLNIAVFVWVCSPRFPVFLSELLTQINS